MEYCVIINRLFIKSMSVAGSSDNVNFEDITASIDLTADLKDDVVCFSSVCTGRYVYFWAQNDNASLKLSTNHCNQQNTCNDFM